MFSLAEAYFDDLFEGIGQEDAGDQDGKYFLGESRDKVDEEDAFESNHHQSEDQHPHGHLRNGW